MTSILWILVLSAMFISCNAVSSLMRTTGDVEFNNPPAGWTCGVYSNPNNYSALTGVPGIYIYADCTATLTYIGQSTFSISSRLSKHYSDEGYCGGNPDPVIQSSCYWCGYPTGIAGQIDFDVYFYEALMLMTFCTTINNEKFGGPYNNCPTEMETPVMAYFNAHIINKLNTISTYMSHNRRDNQNSNIRSNQITHSNVTLHTKQSCPTPSTQVPNWRLNLFWNTFTFTAPNWTQVCGKYNASSTGTTFTPPLGANTSNPGLVFAGYTSQNSTVATSVTFIGQDPSSMNNVLNTIKYPIFNGSGVWCALSNPSVPNQQYTAFLYLNYYNWFINNYCFSNIIVQNGGAYGYYLPGIGCNPVNVNNAYTVYLHDVFTYIGTNLFDFWNNEVTTLGVGNDI